MLTREKVAKVLSEILSDRYDAEITVILKEVEPNVPNMPTDTMSESMSQCNAQDCA